MSTTETALIAWAQGKYNGYEGSAGDIRLFSITWKTQRGDPDWLMRTDLPGMQHKSWKSDDADGLKADAEKVLAAWMARVSGNAKEASQ